MLREAVNRLDYLESLYEALTTEGSTSVEGISRGKVPAASKPVHCQPVSFYGEDCVPIEHEGGVRSHPSPDSGYEEIMCTDSQGKLRQYKLETKLIFIRRAYRRVGISQLQIG